jgi:hypothetical protein
MAWAIWRAMARVQVARETPKRSFEYSEVASLGVQRVLETENDPFAKYEGQQDGNVTASGIRRVCKAEDSLN